MGGEIQRFKTHHVNATGVSSLDGTDFGESVARGEGFMQRHQLFTRSFQILMSSQHVENSYYFVNRTCTLGGRLYSFGCIFLVQLFRVL